MQCFFWCIHFRSRCRYRDREVEAGLPCDGSAFPFDLNFSVPFYQLLRYNCQYHFPSLCDVYWSRGSRSVSGSGSIRSNVVMMTLEERE